MSFIEQVKNQRIQALSRNIIGEVTGVSQVWDTYKESLDAIFADDYWDLDLRPLQTNDEIEICFHDPENDGICGKVHAIAGFAEVKPGYKYKSKLIRADNGFCTLDVCNVKDITAAKEFELNLAKAAKLSEVYVFVKGEKTTKDVTVVNGTVTITVPAGTESGGYAVVKAGFAEEAAAKLSFKITSAAEETAKFDIHLVGVFA